MEEKGQAFEAKVRMGWVLTAIGGIPLKGTAEGRILKNWLPPAAGNRASGLAGICTFTFQMNQIYTPLAHKQVWTYMKNRGYQPSLGIGKCTNPEFFEDFTSLAEVQLYMRQLPTF